MAAAGDYRSRNLRLLTLETRLGGVSVLNAVPPRGILVRFGRLPKKLHGERIYETKRWIRNRVAHAGHRDSRAFTGSTG